MPHRRSEAFLRVCRLPFFIFLRWVFIGRVGNNAFTKPRNCAYFVLDIAQLCLKYTKLEKKSKGQSIKKSFPNVDAKLCKSHDKWGRCTTGPTVKNLNCQLR